MLDAGTSRLNLATSPNNPNRAMLMICPSLQMWRPLSPLHGLITSAKEVMFSSALISLCVSRIMQKKLLKRFPKILVKKVAQGPQKKDFGGSSDHFTLGLCVGRDRNRKIL